MDFIDWCIACQHCLSRTYFVKHRIQVDGCCSAYSETPVRLMTIYFYVCRLQYVTYVLRRNWYMSKLIENFMFVRVICTWGFIFCKWPLSSVCACKWNMYCSICSCAHTTSHVRVQFVYHALKMLVGVVFLRLFGGQHLWNKNWIAPVEAPCHGISVSEVISYIECRKGYLFSVENVLTPKRRSTFSGLHGVIFQHIVFVTRVF
jgi:hypothetical protein